MSTDISVARCGKPAMFNTDQGSRFIGSAFIGMLAIVSDQHGRSRLLA
jgi:hypothetical protein